MVIIKPFMSLINHFYLHAECSRTIESSIGVSYVEVYGDSVTDLLKMGSLCGHSKVKKLLKHSKINRIFVSIIN